jgi:hypothetical protein
LLKPTNLSSTLLLNVTRNKSNKTFQFAKTLSMTALCIKTPSIDTLIILMRSTTKLSIKTLSITTQSIMTLSKMT